MYLSYVICLSVFFCCFLSQEQRQLLETESRGHLLAFLLNLIYKSCHMTLHEFQLFILFRVDFLQSADAIHKNSLIRRQLCVRPVVLLPLG